MLKRMAIFTMLLALLGGSALPTLSQAATDESARPMVRKSLKTDHSVAGARLWNLMKRGCLIWRKRAVSKM